MKNICNFNKHNLFRLIISIQLDVKLTVSFDASTISI